MRIHELAAKRQQSRKRKGRGISAGRGKTAGRGTKGQNSRTGGGVRPGFEGGQNPLSARLPKLAGFRAKGPGRATITTKRLAKLKPTTIDNQVLADAGIINLGTAVKVVFAGELKTAKTVKLQAASSKAIEVITQAGGAFTAVKPPRPTRSSSVKSTKS